MSESESVKVSVRDGTVTIELPLKLLREPKTPKRKRGSKPDWSILKTTRGLWRRRRVDGLAYQRKARQEWAGRTTR